MNIVGISSQVIDKSSLSSFIFRLLSNFDCTDRYQITVVDKKATEIASIELSNLITITKGKNHQTKASIDVFANYNEV